MLAFNEYIVIKNAISKIAPDRVKYLRSLSKLKDNEGSDKRFVWSLLFDSGLTFYNCDFIYKYLDGKGITSDLKQIALELGHL